MRLLEKAEKAIYIYTHGYLETLNNERKNVIIGKNAWSRLRSIFSEIIKECGLFISSKSKIEDCSNQIICLVNSNNNYEAIKFLEAEKGYLLLQTSSNKILSEAIVQLKFKNKIWFSILFLFYIPGILIGKNSKYILLLHKAFGYSQLFKNEFKKNKPKAVLFTNDHTPKMRSFLLACQELQIETIYLQHAAVSKFFPPLTFDLALLDGKVSEDVYKEIAETSCKIKFIGIPKLDDAIQLNRIRREIKTVGLAMNQNDDVQTVGALINFLQSNNLEVIFRKHPLDNREIKLNHKIINGNSLSLMDFIYKIDFLIAGDSSIHVEANSLKCRSVYYTLHKNKNTFDYYGFVKKGYINVIYSHGELIKYIRDFNYMDSDFSSPIFKYYNDVMGTHYYGKSSLLVKKFLNEDINHKL